MIRPLLALCLLSAIPAAAHAGPCDSEAAIAKKAGADPALASPTEPEAIERMRSGNKHHAEASKRASTVATQDLAAAEFQAAIDDFVAAAMISAKPSVLYNLAITYRTSGDYEKAIEQYRLFLDRAKPRRPLRRLVECHIESMTVELGRAAAKAPPREPVSPDDATSGTVPQPPVDAPRTVASAPAPDSPAADASLELRAGPMTAAPHWYSDRLGWGIASTGATVAAVGAVLLLDARSLRVQSNDEPSDDVRVALRDKADQRQTWGTIATVAGGVALAAGIIKLARTPEAPSAGRAQTSLRVSPTGIALEGRF